MRALSRSTSPPRASAPEAGTGSWQQRHARDQQQAEHQLAEAGLVEPAVELEAEPDAEQNRRQAECDQLERRCVERAADAKPRHGRGEDRDAGRLEDRPLLVPGPGAQAAPY